MAHGSHSYQVVIDYYLIVIAVKSKPSVAINVPGKGRNVIDLFHPTIALGQTNIDQLSAFAGAVGVQLHLYVTPRDGFLTAGQIREIVPEWRSASIWFCGPTAFGNAVQRGFLSNGLLAADFHQELFQVNISIFVRPTCHLQRWKTHVHGHLTDRP